MAESPTTPTVHTAQVVEHDQPSVPHKDDLSVNAIQLLAQEVAQIKTKVDEIANHRSNSRQNRRANLTNKSSTLTTDQSMITVCSLISLRDRTDQSVINAVDLDIDSLNVILNSTLKGIL